MKIVEWLTGRFSRRGKAIAIYKRGMVKARKKNHAGAIEDYTTAIDMPETPTDVRAMTLYNRAIVYVTTGEESKGIADLNSILAMSDMLINVKCMARQKLARIAAHPPDHNRRRNSA